MISQSKILASFFERSARLVDAELNRIVPSERVEPERLHKAIRWSLFAGGKRFRPALVFAVGRCFGAENGRLLRTAAAVELIHTYSLVHDDLPSMDNDDLRRGRATCHVEFDEATAILAGDAMQTLAFQTIAEDRELDAETRVKLVSLIARAAGTPSGMVAGQQLDLDAEGSGKCISKGDVEQIHHSKTGALIAASAGAGAIIAGADRAMIESVTNYAKQLGMLFQITDDLLDVTQTTEALGKTAGKDVSAEKATFPSLYGVQETAELAGRVYANAISELENIDGDSGLLRDIAGYILSRKT